MIYESAQPAEPRGRIDELVFANLKRLGIAPAGLSSDAVFLRRAYLETIGTLPTVEEARDFLAAPDRPALIDKLLEREEFADYWANKWCDILRVKAEFPINLWPNAAQAYHHWVRASIRENKPYDRFVREMLTETGSNFRSAPVNFYRAMQNRTPQGIAQTVALTFMGIRTECPDIVPFFAKVQFKDTTEWKEEILIAAADDPRRAFADRLISGKHPTFSKAIVNRIWCWLFGRGIVHEPDDFRPDNPPENPELLAFLSEKLVDSGWNLREIYRLILNSTTWQLAPLPRTDRPGAAVHFAHYPLRRMDAEVLIDALNQITGSAETYSSAIPEPYTFMPEGQRAVCLPDGSISSSFLELFGRPARDTGLDSERNNRMTDAQRLHMLNSSHVLRKIEQGPKMQGMIRQLRGAELLNALYLSILSRPPAPEEARIVQARAKTRADIVDLAWALINSTEFLYRH